MCQLTHTVEHYFNIFQHKNNYIIIFSIYEQWVFVEK